MALFYVSENFINLYRANSFYAAPDFNRFSYKRLTPEFITYSENQK